MRIRTGSCLCGAVAYRVEGEPLRVGLCHCADCRKSSGSAFVFFAVWPRPAFSHSGEIATFAGRSFCPACGSRLFCLQEDAAEIRLGSLDSPPSDLVPDHEVWIKRREAWLPQLPRAEQFAEDAD
ncbi:aldehyde-activating protein [Rhizobium leguminosarum bv. trifolii]|uniref:Aldehyde-activating protein n=1 Tax=Rhizobium leguminosarum bv. trifolii TaxID=386 RepID=A0A3E1BR46_RHILT|nr:GFA family protein [Rhizobium leguminosarum]RFB94693.1 aldehyde-activating protein [Rhizobium leguminosarum bv. trifolii]RFB96065.1 aldehyde-activating protein [Rhizobium leguminosarum bv. trifolii]